MVQIIMINFFDTLADRSGFQNKRLCLFGDKLVYGVLTTMGSCLTESGYCEHVKVYVAFLQLNYIYNFIE